MLVPLALVGCSAQKPEKERFIEANKEATCMVLKSASLTDPSLKDKALAIFKKYGFDTSDEKAMKAIGEKYQKDPDVEKANEQAIKDCGGEAAADAPVAPAKTEPAKTK